jgi:mannitol/fructose-specific phosphotransferase system IIA component (Ntr-type)
MAFPPLESSLLLSELLSPERVRVPLGSLSKAELLRELVRVALHDKGRDASEETVGGVIDAVEAREAEVSTALGGGLAVPHGRTDLVDSVRVAAALVDGVSDYRSPDGSPVRVVFLVLTPAQASTTHIKVLARIARLMHRPESRNALLASRSAEEFLDVIRRADAEKKVLVS